MASITEIQATDTISASRGTINTNFSNLNTNATTSVTGVVELATNAETLTGTDTERAVTPDDLLYVLKNAVYPIGSVYTNYSDSTNPATLLGFGTWTAIEGEVVVGFKSGDSDFGTAGAATGAKTVTLTSAQSGVPAHTHPQATTTIINNGSTDAQPGAGYYRPAALGGTTQSNTAANASQAHNNIQPSRICYVWRRTA